MADPIAIATFVDRSRIPRAEVLGSRDDGRSKQRDAMTVPHDVGAAPQGSPFSSGGGVCGELLRAIDWARSPLGPVERWPQSLKTSVGLVLNSRQPMFLFWGPELIQFYNDASLRVLGDGLHPSAMGQHGAHCWRETWPTLAPQLEGALHHGSATENIDQLVPVVRGGRLQEQYWTYGCSPVPGGDGAVGGVLVVSTNTTDRVLEKRRAATIRALLESTSDVTDRSKAYTELAGALAKRATDFPFAAIGARYPSSGALEVVQYVGISRQAFEASVLGPLETRLRETFPQHASHDPRPAPMPVALAAPVLWNAPFQSHVHEFVVETISDASSLRPSIVLALGLSPSLPFDDAHRAHVARVRGVVEAMCQRIDGSVIRTMSSAERDSLLMQAPFATALMTGPDHVFRLANPLFCDLVGRSDLVGKPYRAAFPELSGSELAAILDAVLTTGASYTTEEQRVPLDRRGDGNVEDHYFKFSLDPVSDASGRVYGMTMLVVDITEQARARAVLERNDRDREKLLLELENASRAKDEFLAMLGHELRNPLSPIVTALQIMKMRTDGAMTNEQRIIERQVGHLVRLVDDLLDVSKITRGKVELKKQMVDIDDVLKQAVEIASTLFEQRGHYLAVTVESGLRWRGDPTRLAQVVANLLTNAARYTAPGGHVELRARRENSELVISVKDDGVGISAEMLPRIFDVFVQGHRSRDRAEGGLGIGLALVKNLVALHDGTVIATSAGRGMGSEFTIRLPLMRRWDSSRTLQAVPDVAVASATRRVMIVDDNEDSADMVGQMLRLRGHETAVAHDPLEAISLVSDFRPEVALLDIGLPGMDGYELARILRGREELRGCRFIAVTGYGQEQDRTQSRLAGFERHLVKPVDMDTLARIIADA